MDPESPPSTGPRPAVGPAGLALDEFLDATPSWRTSSQVEHLDRVDSRPQGRLDVCRAVETHLLEVLEKTEKPRLQLQIRYRDISETSWQTVNQWSMFCVDFCLLVPWIIQTQATSNFQGHGLPQRWPR